MGTPLTYLINPYSRIGLAALAYNIHFGKIGPATSVDVSGVVDATNCANHMVTSPT